MAVTGEAHEMVVVGGGVIGLAVAWRAADAGVEVAVVDPEPGRGASWAAAGMLAPVAEVQYEEEHLLELTLASAERYPSFVAELEEATGEDVGYRRCGTLMVAGDADDMAALDELHDFQQRLGLEVTRLRSREVREREPLLAPSVRGGLFTADDHAVDNRALVRALLTACETVGVDVVRDRVAEVLVEHAAARGVVLDRGEVVQAPTVVLAAGAWSASIPGVPESAVPPVRPVKGELLYVRARHGQSFIGHTVRALVKGSHVYLVAREDGRYVVGATAEEQGFDEQVTVGGVWQLLRDAREVLPSLTELDLLEAVTGLRPGSPDNAPILGATQVEGLIVATGHHRNGILLTPITADAIAGLLTEGKLPEPAARFSLQRFADTGTSP